MRRGPVSTMPRIDSFSKEDRDRARKGPSWLKFRLQLATCAVVCLSFARLVCSSFSTIATLPDRSSAARGSRAGDRLGPLYRYDPLREMEADLPHDAIFLESGRFKPGFESSAGARFEPDFGGGMVGNDVAAGMPLYSSGTWCVTNRTVDPATNGTSSVTVCPPGCEQRVHMVELPQWSWGRRVSGRTARTSVAVASRASPPTASHSPGLRRAPEVCAQGRVLDA